MGKDYVRHIDRASAMLPDLALAIAKKIIGRELKHTPLSALRETVVECVSRLIDEPRIIIYVHSELMQPMQTELRQIAQNEGFPGVLEVRSDDQLAQTDCRIEWRNGLVERQLGQLLSQVETLLKMQGEGLRSNLALESYDRLKNTSE
jgi:flagellar assembly protein FliH